MNCSSMRNETLVEFGTGQGSSHLNEYANVAKLTQASPNVHGSGPDVWTRDSNPNDVDRDVIEPGLAGPDSDHPLKTAIVGGTALRSSKSVVSWRGRSRRLRNRNGADIMANYIVTYDLNGIMPTHAQVDAHIATKSDWKRGRVLETVWYIGTNASVHDVYDHFTKILGTNDRLLVVKLGNISYRNLLVDTSQLQAALLNNA